MTLAPSPPHVCLPAHPVVILQAAQMMPHPAQIRARAFHSYDTQISTCKFIVLSRLELFSSAIRTCFQNIVPLSFPPPLDP